MTYCIKDSLSDGLIRDLSGAQEILMFVCLFQVELSIFIILAQASFMSFFLGFLRSHSLNSLTLLDGQTEPKILRLVIGMRNEC